MQQKINNPSIIMINSKEEQQFIEKLVFDDKKNCRKRLAWS